MSLCEMMMGRPVHLAPTVLRPAWTFPASASLTGAPDQRAPANENPEARAVSSRSRERAGDTAVRAGLRIRPVRRADDESWAALRHALWPDAAATELYLDIERWWWTGDRDVQCLVAEDHGRLVGFIELSIRRQAEGGETHRVAWVEGCYVAPDVRRRGIGRALITAGESWGRERGCSELGSDSATRQAGGHGAHTALGFREVATIVRFRKGIGTNG